MPLLSVCVKFYFRFQFDDEGLGVIRAGEETQNVFVGGTNKWYVNLDELIAHRMFDCLYPCALLRSYDAFVNWEFWFPNFPILVYFKASEYVILLILVIPLSPQTALV